MKGRIYFSAFLFDGDHGYRADHPDLLGETQFRISLYINSNKKSERIRLEETRSRHPPKLWFLNSAAHWNYLVIFLNY